MTNSSNAPAHNRAQWRRPTFTRTTAADHNLRYLGRLRSSCGHTLGVAAVWRGRQCVVQWAVCR